MLNNEQSNVEELLKQKEDKKYKKTEISSQSQTGDSDICYPTVGAVRDFVNYIKADLEGYIDEEINALYEKQNEVYTKKEIDSLLSNKVNKHVGGSFINANEYTRTDTIYTSVDFGVAENGVHEYGTLICVQGMGKANKYTQFAFTNLGRVLRRRQINGTWEGYFDEIVLPMDGALNEFSGHPVTNNALTQELNTRLYVDDYTWYPHSLSDLDEYTNNRTMYQFFCPGLNERVALIFMPGEDLIENDDPTKNKFPFSSQILISASGNIYVRKADKDGIFGALEKVK